MIEDPEASSVPLRAFPYLPISSPFQNHEYVLWLQAKVFNVEPGQVSRNKGGKPGRTSIHTNQRLRILIR